MKRCPECGRTYHTLTHCLNDGAALVEDASKTTFSFYFPASARGASKEVLLADFEEAPAAPAYPEAPAFRAPPLAVPTGAVQAAPPHHYALQTRRTRGPQPGVALLCILGLFGLFVGGLEMLRHGLQEAALKEDSPPATAPSTAADAVPDLFPGLKLDDTLTQTPDDTLRQSLIAAVKDADAADTESFSTLDPAPLRSFYAGPALAGELDEIQSLRKNGATQKSRLAAQRFKDFKVNPAHTKAQVDVAEKWSTITRSKASGKVTHKDPPNTSFQVISLTHTAHGWVIENVQFYEL